MKKVEFENIKDSLIIGNEYLIRYFTYNKNDYIDIIVKYLSNTGGFFPGVFIRISEINMLRYHDNYTGKNEPQIDSIRDGYTYLKVSNILFMRPGSFRAEKIKQIKKRNEKSN